MNQENQIKFQVGDTVTWTSQAGGNAKTKTGRIVVIVSARKFVRDVVLENGYRIGHLGCLSSRDHESYLIQVGKSKRLYWPLVKYLEKLDFDPNEMVMARDPEHWEELEKAGHKFIAMNPIESPKRQAENGQNGNDCD